MEEKVRLRQTDVDRGEELLDMRNEELNELNQQVWWGGGWSCRPLLASSLVFLSLTRTRTLHLHTHTHPRSIICLSFQLFNAQLEEAERRLCRNDLKKQDLETMNPEDFMDMICKTKNRLQLQVQREKI